MAGFALMLLAWSASGALAVEDHDLRFLESLRQRRLFELAAEFCQEQLADQELTEADRATLTIELARGRAGQALHASRRERDASWQAATEVLSEFARRYPAHPRLFLVHMQEALIALARGELARQEAEVGADAARALDDARTQLREAARRLEELEKALQREIPRRLNSRLAAGELSSEELSSLLDNVRYQLARAYRNQALSYPPGSLDRVSALTRAIDFLNQVRQSVGEGAPLAWSCRLELAACNRLLDKPAEAARQLADLDLPNAPPAVVLDARAEQARQALAADRLDQALSAISQGRTAQGETSPELDFAHLEVYIAHWKAAETKNAQNDAATWRGKAVAMTRLIEETHGPYWRRRAESLLTGSASGSADDADLEILVRTARDHYLRKRFDEAVQSYDTAARQAHAAGDDGQAFDLFYKAAAIEHERQNRREAARRFRDLATAMPENPLAAQTHLLACFNLAQAAREDPTQLDAYAAGLEENIRLWPHDADPARLWLGKLRESQQRWADATAAYRGVAPAHSEYAKAVAGAARAAVRWLDKTTNSEEGPSLAAENLAAYFERIVDETKDGMPPASLAAARTAALAAARIRLQHQAGGHAAAQRVLQSALQLPDPPDDWRAEATALLVAALAGQPRHLPEAMERLDNLGNVSAQSLWEVIQSLASLGGNAPETTRPQLAQLTLAALDRLGPNPAGLPAAERVAAERLRAEAFADAGRADEAQKLYAQLARQHPQDASIQEGYGQLLLDYDDPTSRQAALRQWRLVGQKSQPRSDRWWRAKYHVAWLLYQSGDQEQATQLIRYLQAVPPGLDDSPLKQEFLNLLER